MSVPSNCAELVLECSEVDYPCHMRGGARVACLRSTQDTTLEAQLEASTRRVHGNARRQPNRGLLGNLDAGVPPSPSTCCATSKRENNPGDILALHAVMKLLIKDGFVLVRDAVKLYAATKEEFLLKLRISFSLTHADIFVPSRTSTQDNVRGLLV